MVLLTSGIVDEWLDPPWSPLSTASALFIQGKAWWYEIQTGPDRSNGRPLPQDPTACLRTRPRIQTPVHAHPKACSTGSPRRGPAELVSVPPSSTTPDACGPSRLTGHRDPGAALDHSHEESGQCSLERR